MNVIELSKIAALATGALFLSSMLLQLPSIAGTGTWRVIAYSLSVLVVAGPCLFFPSAVGRCLRGGGDGAGSVIQNSVFPVRIASALLGLWWFASGAEGLIRSLGVDGSHLSNKNEAFLFSSSSIAALSIILVLQVRIGWVRGVERREMKSFGVAHGQVSVVALRAISLILLVGAMGGIARMAADWFAVETLPEAIDLVSVALHVILFLGIWFSPIWLIIRREARVDATECEGSDSAFSHHLAIVALVILGLWMVMDGLADLSYWAFLMWYCPNPVAMGCDGSASAAEQAISAVSALIQFCLAILVLVFRSSLARILSSADSK